MASSITLASIGLTHLRTRPILAARANPLISPPPESPIHYPGLAAVAPAERASALPHTHTMALWPFSWGSAAPDPSSSPKHSSPASLSTKHVSAPGGAVDPDADAGTEAQTALASWAALLEPFKGGQLPEKARTDPSIRQKLVTTAPALWEYLPFLAKQGTFRLALLRGSHRGNTDLRLTFRLLFHTQAPPSRKPSSSITSTVHPNRHGVSSSPSSRLSSAKSRATRTFPPSHGYGASPHLLALPPN